MAITFNNSARANSKTAGTTLAVTYPAAFSAGVGVIAYIAKDNTSSGTDGDNSEVSSVTDSAGNTFTKLKEFTNVQGGSASGATISVWECVLTNAVTTSDSVTFNFASCTAKVGQLAIYNLTAGTSDLILAGSATLANDNLDPGSMTISGLTSHEYLFFRATACEDGGHTGTATTNFSILTDALNATSGGGAASNMATIAEYRILTGTTATSDPTYAADDNASVFLAIQEQSGNPPLAPTVQTYTLTAQAVTLSRGLKHNPTAQTYAINAQSAGLSHGYRFAPTAQTYTVTAQAVTLKRALKHNPTAVTYSVNTATSNFLRYTRVPLTATVTTFAINTQTVIMNQSLPPTAVTYVYSPQTATLRFGHKLAPTAVSYTITGPPTGLAHGYVLAPTVRTYAVNTQSVTLNFAHKQNPTVATYTLSATAVIMNAAFRPTAVSYSITAQNVTLRFGHSIPASTTNYSINAQVVGLAQGHKLNPTAQTYSIASQPVTLKRTYVLAPTAATYVVNGIGASLSTTSNLQLSAATQTYTVSGSASLIVKRDLNVTQTSYNISYPSVVLNEAFSPLRVTYAISGSSILVLGRKLNVTTTSYNISGQTASLNVSRKLPVTAQTYIINGSATLVQIGSFQINPSVQTYAVSGSATLRVNRILSVSAQSYVVQTQGAFVALGTVFNAVTITYNISGPSVNLIKAAQNQFIVDAQTYNIAGSATLAIGRKLKPKALVYQFLFGQRVIIRDYAITPLSISYQIVNKDVKFNIKLDPQRQLRTVSMHPQERIHRIERAASTSSQLASINTVRIR